MGLGCHKTHLADLNNRILHYKLQDQGVCGQLQTYHGPSLVVPQSQICFGSVHFTGLPSEH